MTDTNLATLRLAHKLRENAEFHRRKLVEYPNDRRHAQAADESDRLATDIENGTYTDEGARNYNAFCEDGRTSYFTSEAESTLIAGIGFHQFFDNADVLLRVIVDCASGPHDDVEFIPGGQS